MCLPENASKLKVNLDPKRPGNQEDFGEVAVNEKVRPWHFPIVQNMLFGLAVTHCYMVGVFPFAGSRRAINSSASSLFADNHRPA